VIPETVMILRLLLAAVLGAMIGFQRERHSQPAGLRTHTILVVGSALAMMLSINLAMAFRLQAPNGDPARLAAQVISGIGFLGAGAILREGFSVKGLTTATSMWTMAIVGLAVGMGYFVTSISVTILLLVVLSVLFYVEKRYVHPFMDVFIALKADDRPGLIEEVTGALSQKTRRIENLGLRRNLEEHHLVFEISIETREKEMFIQIVTDLSAIPGVHNVKVS
jgi:putative Mg2+ transporter-C (MgtC) family protein